MTEAEIKAVVDKLADIAAVLHDADPDDKAEVFRQLGLKLTYPGRQLVQAEIEVPRHWQIDSSEGDLNTEAGEISPDRGDSRPRHRLGPDAFRCLSRCAVPGPGAEMRRRY